MSIEWDKDARDRSIASIKQVFAELMDQEIGDLKAALLLDFILKEIGPGIYNRGVADAQARTQEFVSELDATCYEPEFTYWKRRGAR